MNALLLVLSILVPSHEKTEPASTPIIAEHSLRIGMPKADVIGLLGNPESVSRTHFGEERIQLFYRNEFCEKGSTCSVVIQNNQLVQMYSIAGKYQEI